ncbi:hypothetical protein RND81_09G009100 [Saponaria officinalis]|uniref:Uncharacterized protein n=1 Tax=Saponaria officinalis TaxID=3572 RepID=A0AAW1IH07_SAPOF
MSARWLSSRSGGFWVKEKMSEDDINHLRHENIIRKIYAEYFAVDCYDDESFLKLERLGSQDFQILKSLHSDLKKYKRKNGIVPPPLKDPRLRPGFGVVSPESLKPRKDDAEVIE